MGVFSISCGISGLPIYSQRIALLILKRTYKMAPSFEKNFIGSNEGSRVFFTPSCPVIYGSADSYGNIEHIDLGENFDKACKILGINNTEKDFCDWVEKDWMGIPSDEFYITFFLEEVFKSALEFSKQINHAHNYLCQHWVLESFPSIFELSETLDRKKERYYLIYSVKGTAKLIASDGKFIHKHKSSEPFFRTNSLLEWINDPAITKEIMSGPYLSCYDIILKDRYDREFFLNKAIGCTEPEFNQYDVDNMLIASYMDHINRYFAPVYSGPQHNDYQCLKHLNQITSSIIDKELKELQDE